jgi:aspartyl/asparaginyl beta-hydroxylase (cupin superfamily)
MNIHTIRYSDIKSDNEYFNKLDIKIWNRKNIIKLIKKSFPEYLDYYKKIILLKTRENFVKYLILKKHGGLFINYNILDNLNNYEYLKIHEIFTLEDSMIFYKNKNNLEIINNYLDAYELLLNDDIVYIKNKNNSFINYLINNWNLEKIPENEYDNKYQFGNLYLTNQFIDFFEEINMYIYKNKIYKSLWYNENTILNKYENDIIKIQIKNVFFSNIYINKTYPNIPILKNPECLLKEWDYLYKLVKYTVSFIIIICIYYLDTFTFFVVLTFLSSLQLVIKYLIINSFDYTQNKYIYDNITFFDPNNFSIFEKIKKDWKIIAEEAKKVLKEAPKLDIHRDKDLWVHSDNFFNVISKKYGWIKSFSNKENNDSYCNKDWLNYGIIFNGKFFKENKKYCPKTYKLLKKIKEHINICGFSYMKSGCCLTPHEDFTGLETNSLAFHLGLDIPEPNNTCRLYVKNKIGKFCYNTEKNGKVIIFDSQNTHCAYNQSDKDRLILYIDFKII